MASLGLAGCTTCDCPGPFRRLSLFPSFDDWTPTPVSSPTTTDASYTQAASPTTTKSPGSPSRTQFGLSVEVIYGHYRTDGPRFSDVTLFIFDRDEQRLEEIAIGGVSATNGFTKKTTDMGCCDGQKVSYTKTITTTLDRFPWFVGASADVRECDQDRDRLAYAKWDGDSNYIQLWSDWRNDQSLPFSVTATPDE